MFKFEGDVVTDQAAEAVPLPAEWCQSIMDALPAAMCICDSRGVVVACNKAAVELWGASLSMGIRGEKLFR